MKFLWEVLVPVEMNNDKIPTSYHKQWDKFCLKLVGGLTIYRPGRGQWISASGKLYNEMMIPVRIFCTRKQLEAIIRFTIEHYQQKAVAAYLVSKKFIIRKKGDGKKKAFRNRNGAGSRNNKLRSKNKR